MTDAEIKAALPEFYALALTILGEASGEPIEGKVFVGCIVRNRVRENKVRYGGNTYEGVCLKRAQFSCWFPWGGQANYDRVLAQGRRLLGDHVEIAVTPKDPALDECLFIAEGVIGGQLKDRANGANHYCTTALWKTKPPDWAKGRTPVVVCGAHVGFRL